MSMSGRHTGVRPIDGQPLGPRTSPKKFRDLMILWRADLERTDYGKRRDTSAPLATVYFEGDE